MVAIFWSGGLSETDEVQRIRQAGLEIEIVGAVPQGLLKSGDGGLIGFVGFLRPSQLAEHVSDAHAGPQQVVLQSRVVAPLSEELLVESHRRAEQIGTQGTEAWDVEQFTFAHDGEGVVNSLAGTGEVGIGELRLLDGLKPSFLGGLATHFGDA